MIWVIKNIIILLTCFVPYDIYTNICNVTLDNCLYLFTNDLLTWTQIYNASLKLIATET